MSYLPLDQYQRKWIFSHSSMPVPAEALETIKPMDMARSAQFWRDYVSQTSPDAERIPSADWPARTSNWSNEVDWMTQWEADDGTLPEAILSHMIWQDDVTIYFCYEKYNVIETKWLTFKHHWKNFLFYDDGPMLLGRKRDEVLWFHSDGMVKLGKRPR